MADIRSNIQVNIDTANAMSAIKSLQAQITAFHSSIRNSGNAANQAVSSNLTKNLVNSVNATKQFSASLTTINDRASSFTNALEKNKFSLGQYFKYGAATSKTFGRAFRKEFDTIELVARDRVKSMQTQFVSLGRTANGAIEAIKVKPLTLNMQSLGTQVAMTAQKQQLFNKLLTQGSTNLLNFGKNTQWAGRQLMVGITLPLALLGATAMKTFNEMEEQAIRFKRVYGELFTTEAETKQMVAELQALASEFTKYGVAVADTMGLAADAAAMGKMGADLTAQVAQATRLAVLGGVEQNEALETTISITNAFGVSAEELAGKIDFLNAVENQTVTSIEDLTIAIPKAGPVIEQLGGSVEDLAFFLTAMKEGGINASEGANALKSGLAKMINPTTKATAMLGQLGININGIVEGNAGNIKGAVIELSTALDTLEPLQRARAIEELFGKFQFARISTLFKNVVAEGNQAQRVLELSRSTAEELAILSSRELKRVEDSPLFKFQKSIEDLQKALVPLGQQFTELLTPLISFATDMLNRFNGLDEGVKRFVTGTVAVLGLLAPAALMLFGLFANGVANIIKGFGVVRGLFLKVTYAGTGLNAILNYMTQEHLEATSAANALGTTHGNLTNIFTSEQTAIQNLITSYTQATTAMARFNTVSGTRVGKGAAKGGMKLASGIVSVPGPKGAGDIVPAMLSPGEAVIPADKVQKYGALISGMISDNIPGFRRSNVKVSGSEVTLAGQTFTAPGNADKAPAAAGRLGDELDKLVAGFQVLGMELNEAEEAAAALARATAERSKNDNVSATELRKTEQSEFGGGVALAGNRTVQSREVRGREGNELVKGNEGVTLSHTGTPVPLSNKQRKDLAAQLPAGSNRNKVLDANTPMNAYSESVFPTPAILNAQGGILNKGEAADIIRQNPQGLASEAAESLGLDPNAPAFKKFGQDVANELAADANAAFSDMDLTPAVNRAIDKMEAGVEKKALQDRQKTFRTVGGGKGGKRFSLPKGVGLDLGDGNKIEGGASYVDRRDRKKSEVKLAAHKEADGAVIALARKKVQQAELQGKKEGTAAGKAFSKSRNAVLKKTGDSFLATRQRRSPHKQAAKDGADDGRAYGKAKNAAELKEEKKLRKQAGAQKRAQIGGRAFGALGAASMIAGMGSMAGGPVGDISQKLMGPLMGLSAAAGILPMLMNPIGLVVGALGGLGAAIYLINKRFNDQVTKSYELNIAIGTSTEAMGKFAEAAGKATASQILDKRRESAFGTFRAAAGKTPFGENFIASDDGKKMAAAFGESIKAFGKDGAVSRLTNQLASAVTGGAMDAAQARSVADAFAQSIGDRSLGIGINASLAGLLGPNGENLEKDPLGIRVRILEESAKDIENVFTRAFANGAANVNANPVKFAASGNNVSSRPTYRGRVKVTDRDASAAEIGEVIAVSAAYINNQKLQEDSLQLAYETSIAAAIAAEDQVEATRLQAKFIEDRATLMSMGSETLTNISDEVMSATNTDVILKQFRDKIKDSFKDDPILSNISEALLDKVEKLPDEQEVIISASLLSGDLEAMTLNNILNGENSEKIVDMIVKIGVTEATRGLDLASLLPDGNVKDTNVRRLMSDSPSNVSYETAFLNQLNSLDPADAIEMNNVFQEMTRLSDALGEDGLGKLMAFYVQNPGLQKELASDIDLIRVAAEGVDGLTVEVIQELVTEGTLNASVYDEIKKNQDYFDGLPDDQKVVYTQVLRTLFEVEGSLNPMEIAMRSNPGLFDNLGPQADGNDRMAIAEEYLRKYIPELVTSSAILDDDKTGENDPPPGTGSKKTDPIDAILEKLKRLRDLSIDAKGGIAELNSVIKKGLAKFLGSDQKFLFAGYSADFINAVMAMDDETREKFVKISDGAVKVTTAGRSLNKAYSEIKLGEFSMSLTQGIADVNKQVTAMTKLTARGMSSSDAFDIVKDSALAYAIATSTTTKEVDELIKSFDKLQGLQKDLSNSTPEGMAASVSKGLGDIKEVFAAQEEAVNLAFESTSDYLTNTTNGLIPLAEKQLSDYQSIVGDLNYSLDKIAKQEEVINKKYDDRIESLNKMYEINSDLADQEKGKVDIASALASGDIAAAAKAIQEQRSQEAERQKSRSQEIMESARQSELGSLFSENGKTRLQIETEIKQLQEQIAEVEQKRIKPNQELLADLTRQRDIAIEAIGTDGYLGKTKAEWSLVESGIRLAKSEAVGYKDAIKEALLLIPGLKEAYGKDPIPDPDLPGSGLSTAQNDAISKIKSNRDAVRKSEGTTAADKVLISENMKLIKVLDAAGVDRKLFMSGGGKIPKYYAAGGFAKGTDTIPAMLTPGEFVVRKFAVDKFGVNNLKAINSGANPGSNMYNSYEVNVNVKSEANADQIAKAVLTQIKQVDSQRMRSNRF
jgi:TP901 family phage tail tape measure protein